MATTKSGSHHTKNRAKTAAAGTAVRDRVHELTVAAFRDRSLALNDISKVVQEVLEGATDAVEKSIPSSQRNVLREVFDGLSEGVRSIATAGSAVMKESRDRGRALTGKNVSVAMKRVREANADFLGAVERFAGKASKAIGKELDTLVIQAKKTQPKVAGSVRKVTQAADGRLIELAGETARASVRVARRAVGGLAMGAGGLLEGLAEAVTPKSPSRSPKKKKKAAAQPVKKKPAAKRKS
jgi:hypothetical protein